ncbi:ferredoxin [Candidatus Woesearchaeota archaeon]|nr:ferredoxin [Candidatus Woesearchaeota archaeon]
MPQQIEEHPQNSPQNNPVRNKYILQHDRPNCIGCAACEAVAPDFWEMNSDGKSDIKNGKHMPNEWQELEIEEKNFQANKEAADSCPVNVIHLIRKDTGEKII